MNKNNESPNMSYNQSQSQNPQASSQVPPATESASELSLADIVGIVLDDWKQVVATTFLILFIGLFYLWSSTPIYKVDALVQVEEKDAGASALFGEAGAMFDIASPAQAEIEIVKSRMVLGKVVDNLQLDVIAMPKYFPVIGQAMARGKKQALLPVEAPFAPEKAWGGEQIKIALFEVPPVWVNKEFLIVAQGKNRYQLQTIDGQQLLDGELGEIHQLELAGKHKLRITIENLVARPGTEFVVQRIPRLKAIQNLKAILAAGEKGKKSGMIALSLMHENPRQAALILNEVVALYARQNIDRKSEEAAKTLKFLNEQLPALRERVNLAEGKLNQFRLRTGTIDLSQEASLALSQSVEVETGIVGLKQEQEELMRLYKENHPNVLALKGRIAQFQKQQRLLNRSVKKLPKNQQEFLQLSRDAKVANELYTNMLNNSQQLQVVKAGEIGNVRIVDTAVETLLPVKPNKKSAAILALLLGGFIGVAIALLRRLWNRGVEDPDLVEKKLGLSVYATVPHSKKQESLIKRIKNREKGGQVLSHLESGDLAVESFRSLRTTLHFSMMEAPNNVILLAGPCPGIGKSFVSNNFAAILAQGGSKVLLIDGDMRRGHLHQYFGVRREAGLADLLAGQAEVDACVRATGIEGLDFISTGTIPPNPAELLLSARFTGLLEAVGDNYDYVLIDAPPVLAVTDSTIIAKHAGTTLMLLKYGAHPMREIETCRNRLDQCGANLKGVIFNDVDISSSRYGYGKMVYAYG